MGATQTKECMVSFRTHGNGSLRRQKSQSDSQPSSRTGSFIARLRSKEEKIKAEDGGKEEGVAEPKRGSVSGTCDLETLPEAPYLTDRDKTYLRSTWSTLEADPTTVGIITFTQLFEANPEMKDVFEALREIEMEDVRKSQELQQHAARVMGFVNKVISRLDSEEKYQPLMTELGRRHNQYGAKPHYIDIMGKEFIKVIRPSLVEANTWDDEAESAWLKLFQVISYSMKIGLKDGRSSTSADASGDVHSSPARHGLRLPSLRRKDTASKNAQQSSADP